MPDICVASHHKSLKELLADDEFRGLARKPGYVIELRLDQYSDLGPAGQQEALDIFAPACVVTCRHPAEGGGQERLTDKERVNFLQRGAWSGARYIDCEGRTKLEGFDKNGAKVIRSFHDFQKVPPLKELLAKWDELAGLGADVVKIAVMPKTMQDTLPLIDVLEHGEKRGVPTMLLAMGEVGLWTRVLAGKCGSPFTFARGTGAPGTAPGQPTWTELVDLYRFHEIEKNTPVYSVIGNPIAHSRSPLMHNTALRENNLKGVYLPLKIEGDPIPVLKSLQRVGLRGTSVTIPHKENVQPLCAEIDPVAKQIGAINTLQLRADGTWFGTNTDASAAADSLVAKAGDLTGKTVAIIGAGGAARALAFGVKQRGANVIVTNRTVEKAQALAKEVGGKAVALDDLAALKPAVIVNTTPLGMHPNTETSPLQKDQIPQGGVVFDTVYNPLRTKLLEFAEARGCTTLDGLEMFVGQGVRQFELWTGTKAPREIMRRVVLEALQQKK